MDYPDADTIHLVMDNLSSHTRKALVDRFGTEAGDWLWNRFTAHYTAMRTLSQLGKSLGCERLDFAWIGRICIDWI